MRYSTNAAGGHIGRGSSKGPGEGAATGTDEEEEESPPKTNPFYQMYRYYSSEKKTKPTTDDLQKYNGKFQARMNQMKNMIEKTEKPDGSAEFPARTCRDLFAYRPTFKSGMLATSSYCLLP